MTTLAELRTNLDARPAIADAEGGISKLLEAIGRTVEAIRGGWACRPRLQRLGEDAPEPAADERTLASAMTVLGGRLAGPAAGAGREAALRLLLVEALQEEPTYQHSSVALAATEAIDAVSGKLDAQAAGTVAPALVEALLFRTVEGRAWWRGRCSGTGCSTRNHGFRPWPSFRPTPTPCPSASLASVASCSLRAFARGIPIPSPWWPR